MYTSFVVFSLNLLINTYKKWDLEVEIDFFFFFVLNIYENKMSH